MINHVTITNANYEGDITGAYQGGGGGSLVMCEVHMQDSCNHLDLLITLLLLKMVLRPNPPLFGVEGLGMR